MATNEETNAAGTDTRPPMLVEDDYDSWKIRIQRYIRGKPNGKLIWKSIQNGPTPHPMVTDPPPTGSTIVPGPRKKLDSEFNDEENKLEMADTQAEIILSQDMVDLLKGSRTTNLYSISLNDMMSASPVCLLTKASPTKSWLWHRRLNHLNFGTLNELARNALVRGLPMLKYDKGGKRQY
ncbi:retrovirus-related pol polyprotein from transposon TNT 1-94 [Tanacetum coccineum]